MRKSPPRFAEPVSKVRDHTKLNCPDSPRMSLTLKAGLQAVVVGVAIVIQLQNVVVVGDQVVQQKGL